MPRLVSPELRARLFCHNDHHGAVAPGARALKPGSKEFEDGESTRVDSGSSTGSAPDPTSPPLPLVGIASGRAADATDLELHGALLTGAVRRPANCVERSVAQDPQPVASSGETIYVLEYRHTNAAFQPHVLHAVSQLKTGAFMALQSKGPIIIVGPGHDYNRVEEAAQHLQARHVVVQASLLNVVQQAVGACKADRGRKVNLKSMWELQL